MDGYTHRIYGETDAAPGQPSQRGLLKIVMKPGAAGKVESIAGGKGALLPLPPTPVVAAPQRLRLQGGDAC